jgi:hypothetical protein
MRLFTITVPEWPGIIAPMVHAALTGGKTDLHIVRRIIRITTWRHGMVDPITIILARRTSVVREEETMTGHAILVPTIAGQKVRLVARRVIRTWTAAISSRN